jgi:hypothetical protein
MPAQPKLSVPRLRFWLDAGSAAADPGEPVMFEVQARSMDLIAYEMEAQRQGWPTPGPQLAPTKWMHYVAFRIAKRTKLIPEDMGLSVFEDRCVQATGVDVEAEAKAAAEAAAKAAAEAGEDVPPDVPPATDSVFPTRPEVVPA